MPVNIQKTTESEIVVQIGWEKAWKTTLFRLKIAVFNLLLVALIGILMRYQLFKPIPGLIFPYLVHAHSHLAFLGWVFMALYALILYRFVPTEKVTAGRYRNFFLILQAANLGMLFTFPFTGYAAGSIIFSSVHALVSIAFALFFLKDSKSVARTSNEKVIYLFIRWSLILMIVSNLGPFALGPVIANGGARSKLYFLIIYFYLHFQYNGWFTFAVLGLLLNYFSRRGYHFQYSGLRHFFYLNLIAVFPAYVLSALWLQPAIGWYLTGFVAALMQVVTNFVFFTMLRGKWRGFLRHFGWSGKALLISGLLAFTLKNILQLLSSLPAMHTLAFHERGNIIAYLHLVLIGFITFLIFLLMLKEKFFEEKGSFKLGIWLLMATFLITEIILVTFPMTSEIRWWLILLAGGQTAGLFLLLFSLMRKMPGYI
jgi:hypothetical protein